MTSLETIRVLIGCESSGVVRRESLRRGDEVLHRLQALDDGVYI